MTALLPDMRIQEKLLIIIINVIIYEVLKLWIVNIKHIPDKLFNASIISDIIFSFLLTERSEYVTIFLTALSVKFFISRTVPFAMTVLLYFFLNLSIIFTMIDVTANKYRITKKINLTNNIIISFCFHQHFLCQLHKCLTESRTFIKYTCRLIKYGFFCLCRTIGDRCFKCKV